jgi:hypothetical protein
VTFSYGFDDENIKKKHCSHVPTMLSGLILARWRRPVASSEDLDLLHWAMHTVTYQRIAMAIEMASFAGVFVDCCLCLLLWRPLGQYGASSCPMLSPSGFWSSPGYAALGNVVCIAPAHRRGHQNGRRMRGICSPPPPFLFAVIVA